MRTPRKALFALPATGAAVLALGAAAAPTPPPGSDYAWAQPGAAVAAVPNAQPPAGIPIVASVPAAVPGSGYEWAQPGAALPTVPLAEPPG